MYSKEGLEEINGFEELGFARTSKRLLGYIRKNNIPIKIFDPRKVGTTASKVIGETYKYYVKFENKNNEKFVNYLVYKFYKLNPEPDKHTKKKFTHLLHHHGLHWQECWCKNKIEDK